MYKKAATRKATLRNAKLELIENGSYTAETKKKVRQLLLDTLLADEECNPGYGFPEDDVKRILREAAWIRVKADIRNLQGEGPNRYTLGFSLEDLVKDVIDHQEEHKRDSTIALSGAGIPSTSSGTGTYNKTTELGSSQRRGFFWCTSDRGRKWQ